MKSLQKTTTGIAGFDEITDGGLPQGRTTLVCGGPGCGKTLFTIEFIIRGVNLFNEPGVFMTFEEKPEEIAQNVSSLGFDVEKLQKNKKVKIDYVHIDQHEIEETGEYNLDGLFIRLDHAINSIGAKRVVLDTIENLFAGLTNQGVIRAELRRLFYWLKSKGVTAIVTGEKGEGSLTRHGLEEYVSDCVILLDHRVINQISTRRLRVVKYRGSVHGTNEYPFLIDSDGISVLPITSLTLKKEAPTQRVGTGIPKLDEMFGGKGFYKGSTVLITGTSGTGKTSIASSFADAACKRKERCIYFAFEESPKQIIRNMTSIGINLEQHIKSGYLEFNASRPTLHGLEMHLVSIHKIIKAAKPDVVIVDPITNLTTTGTISDVRSMLIRLIDFLQTEGITTLFTALIPGTSHSEVAPEEDISSLVDTWMMVRDLEMNGERNRGLHIIKSRGIKHSNRVREFLITNNGLELMDVYQGPEGGVLTGTAREAQKLHELTGEAIKNQQTNRKKREIDRQRKIMEARISNLRSEFESYEEELSKTLIEDEIKNDILKKNGHPSSGIRKSSEKTKKK